MFKESLQMQIYSFEEQKQQKKDNPAEEEIQEFKVNFLFNFRNNMMKLNKNQKKIKV